jgi:hypothetical protein
MQSLLEAKARHPKSAHNLIEAFVNPSHAKPETLLVIKPLLSATACHTPHHFKKKPIPIKVPPAEHFSELSIERTT